MIVLQHDHNGVTECGQRNNVYLHLGSKYQFWRNPVLLLLFWGKGRACTTAVVLERGRER